MSSYNMSSSSNDEIDMETTSPKLDNPTPPPSSPVKLEFHPALTVFNIRNNIPIALDMENDRYDIRAKLFRVHARSHQVLHYITPLDNKPPPLVTDPTYDQWATLDATVLQWIYSTILVDLLTTIMEPGSTSLDAWMRLVDHF